MKESKSQSKQDDAKTCHATGARVVRYFPNLRLGFCWDAGAPSKPKIMFA
jgi:hypothetical protein